MISGTSVKEISLPLLDGGLNVRDLDYKIDDSQSPDMLNMWFKDRVLAKRWGQEYVGLTTTTDTTSTAYASVTLSTVHSISPEFEGKACVHAGTKIYKWDEDDTAVDLAVTCANAASEFLEFNGNLYLLDGTEIWQINSSFTCAAVAPYIPVVYINCDPNLTQSTANEAFNLIGAGFTVWYNGDGADASYNLPISTLDATAVTITVGGVALVENTNFTANRTNGIINFAAGTSPHGAPASGINNVVITAYKTVTGAKAKIAGCKVAIAFGGESTDIQGGTRAFLMANPSYPTTYWYSDLGAAQSYGMTYFPDNQYEDLMQNNEPIKAAAKQAGELIIFKTHSLFAVSYVFDGENVFYPIREFNSAIGCDVPKSVQLIDNNLVFANTYDGVFIITNTAGKAEENVKPIGGNINKGLLNEANLSTATSIDYDRKYWLCVGSYVYMWDYELTPFYGYNDYEKAQRRLSWFKHSNISAVAWYGGSSLYYGTGIKLVRFNDSYSDFGSAIEAWWYSKAFDFGLPNYLKTIATIFPSIRISTNSGMTITVSSENDDDYYENTIDIESFYWNGFNWSIFSWNVQKYAKPYKLKVKMKKVVYCQIKLYNNDNYRDMGVSDITFNYTINGRVKR